MVVIVTPTKKQLLRSRSNKLKKGGSLRIAFFYLFFHVYTHICILSIYKNTNIYLLTSNKSVIFVVSLGNYASKFVEKETVKKHYFIDNGLLSVFLTHGEAALLENLCAIHLYRMYGNNVYFYNKNIEVDFYLPKLDQAIQISYSIADEDTRKREVKALLKFHTFQPLKRMVIVTFDEEETIETNNGLTIEVIPAWKWLMEEQPIPNE